MNILEKLKKYNQEHLLRFENELTNEQKQKLYNQINELDFTYLEELNKETVKENITVTPIKSLTISEIKENKNEYFNTGVEELKKQNVGALLLAGGMGTRLGSNNPKGMYNIGKTKDVYIFQRIIENLLDVVNLCGKFIPLFIMTSEHNHTTTTNFFEEHNYFGYDKSYIRFFKQDMAPCVDLNGKILLENKFTVATSPNGNGGWFNSLLNNTEAKQMLEEYDIKWLNIFAVDNVLQHIADPLLVGATIKGNFQIGTKVIRKADAYEKVGVMCNKNGHPSIIEYIDITEEMAHQTDENGERLYNFGSILNHLFNVDLLYRIKDKKLPVHVVTKKVEHIDEQGNLITPEQPNAHKFEMLCVDMIELADNCLPFEVERQKEFAPIKNKTGVDSVESAQALLELNGYKL